ncbi:hypothetical protein J7413_06175 [Shimia sp. R10_1]|uniref:hypothetical protein n=1 Tax=Shimia sp. R10_1 TaxID=2821095 RepID=UPI001ADB28DE|nr:hypothetical protein [Shimia sp. R10_1]MBO9473122.1 hypothetical protein [Shimia sp. R10_1]
MSAWIKDLADIVSGTVNPPWYVNVAFDGDAPLGAIELGLEQSDLMRVLRRADGSISYIRPHIYTKGMVLNRAVVTGKHLWRMRYIRAEFAVSDTFMSLFKAHKLQFLEQAYAEER